MPLIPKTHQGKSYITALENRVAELEISLIKNGQTGIDEDHWLSEQAKESSDKEEIGSFLTAIRDMSLNTSGSFVGATSTITLGRILESLVGNKAKERLVSHQPPWDKYEVIAPEIDETSPPGSSLSNTTCSFQMSSSIADKLLNTYFSCVSHNFPVVHSPEVRGWHMSRDELNDPYKESVLHLVYALGGQFLETVSHKPLLSGRPC